MDGWMDGWMIRWNQPTNQPTNHTQHAGGTRQTRRFVFFRGVFVVRRAVFVIDGVVRVLFVRVSCVVCLCLRLCLCLCLRINTTHQDTSHTDVWRTGASVPIGPSIDRRCVGGDTKSTPSSHGLTQVHTYASIQASKHASTQAHTLCCLVSPRSMRMFCTIECDRAQFARSLAGSERRFCNRFFALVCLVASLLVARSSHGSVRPCSVSRHKLLASCWDTMEALQRDSQSQRRRRRCTRATRHLGMLPLAVVSLAAAAQQSSLFVGAQRTGGTICPNSCNGHGTCDSTRECTCFTGFTGADCSERECLSGAAWFAAPSATDVAHVETYECSNAGACDRSTGVCTCDSRFEGAACDRLRCPTGGTSVPCSGHGRCLTMSQMAQDRNDYSTFVETTYSSKLLSTSQGCYLHALCVPQCWLSHVCLSWLGSSGRRRLEVTCFGWWYALCGRYVGRRSHSRLRMRPRLDGIRLL